MGEKLTKFLDWIQGLPVERPIAAPTNVLVHLPWGVTITPVVVRMPTHNGGPVTWVAYGPPTMEPFESCRMTYDWLDSRTQLRLALHYNGRTKQYEFAPIPVDLVERARTNGVPHALRHAS